MSPQAPAVLNALQGRASGSLSSAVVIPCFNQGVFLAEAIESAIRQTVPPSEILVVDDGSQEDIAAVVGRFPGVRYVRQTNQGLPAARNRGIAETTADVIVFLDADDRLTPIALESSLDLLARNPEWAAVYGDFRRIDQQGNPAPSAHRHWTGSDVYLGLLETNVIAAHPTVAYRRSALSQAGGFDARLRACEDYELYLRLARAFPIGSHPGVVAEIRGHDANMSSNYNLMLRSAVAVLEKETSFCRARSGGQAALQRGLRFWRSFYGEKLARQVARRLYSRQWNRKLGDDVALLARHYPFGSLAAAFRAAARRAFPRFASGAIPPGGARFGSLRRLHPVSEMFGFDRGTPIDRYYIEEFLSKHRSRVSGRVLEIGDNSYTRRFGADRVSHSDVLNIVESPEATIVGDLTSIDIPDCRFDCIILTQTLHLIYDYRAALRAAWRILKPGGSLLMTVPVISQICRDKGGRWDDYWRFTRLSAERTVSEVFPPDQVAGYAYGNVFAAMAFLQGLAASEVKQPELDYFDPNFELIVGICARRPDA